MRACQCSAKRSARIVEIFPDWKSASTRAASAIISSMASGVSASGVGSMLERSAAELDMTQTFRPEYGCTMQQREGSGSPTMTLHYTDGHHVKSELQLWNVFNGALKIGIQSQQYL